MQLWATSFPAHPCAHAHTETSNPDSVSGVACPSLWASQNSAAGVFPCGTPCKVKHSRTKAAAGESWSSKNSVDSLLSLPLVFVHSKNSKNVPRPLSNVRVGWWRVQTSRQLYNKSLGLTETFLDLCYSKFSDCTIRACQTTVPDILSLRADITLRALGYLRLVSTR